MKSNLKEQVADLQKELKELTERFETLLNRIDNHLVPRLQHHDNDLIDLKNKIGNTNIGATLDSDAKRISELENWRDSQKRVNEGFLDQFKEFVGDLNGVSSPSEGMALYGKMMSGFLKASESFVEPEIVVEPEEVTENND